MKNVTISMEDDTLAKVRIEAARSSQSVSRWIAARVAETMDRLDVKAAASARIEKYLETFPGIPLSENGKITIDRDEMYEHLFRRFDHPDLSVGSEVPSQGSDLRAVAESVAGYQQPDTKP